MDTIRTKPAPNNNNKSKLARTFQKVINLRTATKIASNNGICLLNPQSCRAAKDDQEDNNNNNKSKRFNGTAEEDNGKLSGRNNNSRAVMEALVAKLFAGITSIKAAYAELQTAQRPYNGDVIQVADQAVVDELRAISELKRSFLRRELDLSPQVTTMLAEIQEQQALMKTYEITIKKLEAESEAKSSDLFSLRRRLDDAVSLNRSLEKRLNASGSLCTAFENVNLSSLNFTHFANFLQSVLRSVRAFVKVMIKEMESANWDLDLAAKSIEPNVSFSRPSHRCFAFESFVCKTMFEGFNSPSFNLGDSEEKVDSALFFERFRKFRSANPKQLFTQNPDSLFSRLLRSKYVQAVHAKMECSVFGSLNQRKVVTSCGYPETPFFGSFAEMAKRVWLLHCLAFSFGDEVTVFQVRRESRFSEVYMETCASQEALFSSGEVCDASPEAELRVGFTVVPGFKIGRTVIQSQVYLSPAISPAS